MNYVAVKKSFFTDAEMAVWKAHSPVFNMFFIQQAQTVGDVQRRLEAALPGVFSVSWVESEVAALVEIGLLKQPDAASP